METLMQSMINKPMKKIFLFSTLLISIATNAQSILGKWKSFNEKTNKEAAIIEIFQEDGQFYGKLIQLLNPIAKGAVCYKCKGKNKDKPIQGLVIINGLKKDGDEWSGGNVLDPKNGKEYKCYITLQDKNTMKLRGYIGFSLFGRTEYWYREE